MLEETIGRILPADKKAMEACQSYWDTIAKPLRSLGRLEEYVVQLAGIQRTHRVQLGKKALVIFCADNGVVAEGVTQSGQDVTAIVAENFLDTKSCAAIMCKDAGSDIFPIDIGMAVDTPRVEKRKIAYGTKNMAKEPAMTRAQAIAALETGIQLSAVRIERAGLYDSGDRRDGDWQYGDQQRACLRAARLDAGGCDRAGRGPFHRGTAAQDRRH